MPDLTGRIRAFADSLADRYRIEHELGAGGMATVYRAEDIRHHRSVAIKVLHAELSAVLGPDRFLKEIELTANLQHPHILPLFDSGSADGLLYYVMPLVEGETLRARLERERQLPVADAVRIAGEVAAALDYAHRHGVIHRDIKPENVLLHDGGAQVADFGIALAVEQAGGARMTQTGLSLGTPQYMAPEQAMGERAIDARADIYALGAVTYEMLAGEAPFTGPTAQAIVAKVLTEEPKSLTVQRRTVPPHVDDAVLTALEKLPADRFASAAEFATALAGDVPSRSGARTAARARATTSGLWKRVAIVALGAAAGLAAVAAWSWRHAEPEAVSRYVLALSDDFRFDETLDSRRLAVSPDGSRMVWVVPGRGGSTMLASQLRTELEPVLLPGTESARNPFISPDGQQIGFITENPRTIAVMPIAGGRVRVLSDSVVGTGGAAWSSDGYIYFDADLGGIHRLPAAGGPEEAFIPLDTSVAEVGFAWPAILPDGRTMLVRSRRAGEIVPQFRIVAIDLETRERRDVAQGVVADYVEPGYVVWVTSDGTMMGAGFDPASRTVRTEPATIAVGVRVNGAFGGADIAVSRNGSLIYLTGSSSRASDLVWVDRQGVTSPVDTAWKDRAQITSFALSPDGTRLAAALLRESGAEDIWIKSLPAGPVTRSTFGDQVSTQPAWSPDGTFIYYLSNRLGPRNLDRRRADGTGNEETVAAFARAIHDVVPTPDGSALLLRTSVSTPGNGDILRLPLATAGPPEPLLADASYAELMPHLSPDGRWLAYVSVESSTPQVFVRPYPDVGSARWQISTAGATEPRWSRDGRELFYRALGAPDLLAVDIRTAPSFAAGTARVLIRGDYVYGTYERLYDLHPDNRRFLMLQRAGTDRGSQLVRVDGFRSELARRLER